MNKTAFFILASVVLCTLSLRSAAAVPVVTLATIPFNGSISGPAGTTIGWGYSITNDDPALWVSADSLDTSAAFLNGVFDTNNFDLPVIAPNQTATEAFVPNAAGLAELSWNGNAPANAQNSGMFELALTWYTEDPNSCNFSCVYTQAAELTTVAQYDAAITASQAVPEPSSAIYLSSAFLFLWIGFRQACQS